MGTRISDSLMYSHGWSTPQLDQIFQESRRLQCWLEILKTLAKCQAELGIIPVAAAISIESSAVMENLDLDFISAETRRTSHSTLGLIRGIQQILPESAREYIYYGITVQDLTDTWFAMAMRDCAVAIRGDLKRVESGCVKLAQDHRNTVMAGRTHGQLGSPITFGLKAATWADETSRNIERLDQGSARWSVGQLAGATGSLAFFGSQGPALRARFCAALGLGDPGISWTATRDRIAEFGMSMSMIASGLARIGNEIYELQRPEIGELYEPRNLATVGSITMPHKRNPELSEHLDTLARITRAAAGVLVEGMVAAHERDGRGWKAEWVMLPEAALTAGKSAAVAAELIEGLEINKSAMLANVARAGTGGTEQILANLSARVGNHRARVLLQDALALRSGGENKEELAALISKSIGVDASELESWTLYPATEVAGVMIDECIARIKLRSQ